jgi:uncharacterized protein (TIGR02271 family)
MSTSDSPYQRGVSGATIAVMFTNRDTAKAALTELHEAGFRDVWLGVMHGDASTAAGATVAADEGGGMMKSLARFFSGEGAQEQALHQALFAHGLSDDQARRLEATVPAGAAIVTVSGENDVDEAIEILQRNGGTVAGDAMVSGTTAAATPTSPDPGSKLKQTRRLQLREERLLVDKQRVASGEAHIRKEVVSEQQSVDVPTFHEVLFVQRRPVADERTASTSPIDEAEEIRIPLSEERVDVSKRTVVTEEVEVGTREVEGTEHVSDTVRHEELRVDDDTSGDAPRLRR